MNTNTMTVVYADAIGLVMQEGVSEIDCRDGLYHAYIKPIQGNTWNTKTITVHDLRSISGKAVFVTIKRNTVVYGTYKVEPLSLIHISEPTRP